MTINERRVSQAVDLLTQVTEDKRDRPELRQVCKEVIDRLTAVVMPQKDEAA